MKWPLKTAFIKGIDPTTPVPDTLCSDFDRLGPGVSSHPIEVFHVLNADGIVKTLIFTTKDTKRTKN